VKSNAPLENTLKVAQLLAELRSAGLQQGFRCEEIGQKTESPLLAMTKRTPDPRPRIYLSAGIHGDEPAPPLVLLAMLQAGEFDARANWFICPVLNPSGLHRGTREDAQQRDLNRDYQDRQSLEVRSHVHWLEHQPPFDLALCLHEDWEAGGFYLYELNRHDQASLAPRMIHAARGILPIESSAMIDGRATAEPGIIRPISDPLLRNNWPEAIYLCHAHTALCYTLETPTSFPLAQRIAAMSAVIGAALKQAVPD